MGRKEQRSFLVFLGDWVLFGFGLSVVNPSTVVPALVRALTPSAPLIGLVETIRLGAWLLPQLLVAWTLSGTSLTKRHLMAPYIGSRLALALITPLLLLAVPGRPRLALVGLFVLFTLFFVLDACAALPWFDLFTISLSSVNRSRLMGIAQALAGAGGIGVGYLVARVLAGSGPGFPASYAILFAVAGAFMALELAAVSFLRVPPDIHERRRIPLRSFIPWLGSLLARDRDYRRLIVVRLLVGASGLAVPFYIVFGLDVLRLGPESVGVFTAAQVIGGIASAPLMAVLNERRGTRSVIRLVAVMALLLPLLGLGLVLLKGSIGQTALLGMTAVIFFMMGGVNNGNMAGFTNYLLDYAPGAQRAVYIGLANTVYGLVLVAPVVGGWILSKSSYPVLFSVTAVMSLAGLVSTIRLRQPGPAAAGQPPGP